MLSQDITLAVKQFRVEDIFRLHSFEEGEGGSAVRYTCICNSYWYSASIVLRASIMAEMGSWHQCSSAVNNFSHQNTEHRFSLSSTTAANYYQADSILKNKSK